MKISKFLLTPFLLLLFQSIATACTCFYEPIFCRAVRSQHTIVRAVVLDFPDPQLMEVKVLDNIYKEVPEEEILVYGNNGAACSEYLGQFALNDTLILAFSTQFNHDGLDSWFLAGVCGLNFLRYQNDLVVGKITDNISSQTLAEFTENLMACVDLGTSTNDLEANSTINIFPNPVINELQLEIDFNAEFEIEIFSLTGTSVYHTENNRSGNFQIPTANLATGIYFVAIKSEGQVLTRKFLKQ